MFIKSLNRITLKSLIFPMAFILLVGGCTERRLNSGRISVKGVFDPCDYGAAGDGKTLDTKAIQSAIDDCARSGGGKVYLHNGSFLSGTLFLKSNVTLFVEAGATLLGSTDVNDYPITIAKYRSYTDNYVNRSLIYAENLENIGITGRGIIDGQGEQFPRTDYSKKDRPYVIRFIQCRNVLVEDVSMRNSAMWMQHYLACEGVVIRGINVWNHSNNYNDMIDIDSCSDVVVSDCIADTDDDALTFKSTSAKPCENITVTNCVLRSMHAVIKTGTESNGGFKNITISNCYLEGTRKTPRRMHNQGYRAREGIALLTVDGGQMENITISNIVIKDVRTPIFLRIGNRARPFNEDMPKPPVGTMRNIKISNLIATGASKYGNPISGIPDNLIENVTLSNIIIDSEGGGTAEHAMAEVPELETDFPQSRMFGILPAYGFFIRHACNVTLDNVQLGYADEDIRPAVFCDDVSDLKISALGADGNRSTDSLIRLRQVNGALVQGCRVTAPAQAFIRAEGDRTAGIAVMNNDLTGPTEIFRKSPEIQDDALWSGFNRTNR